MESALDRRTFLAGALTMVVSPAKEGPDYAACFGSALMPEVRFIGFSLVSNPTDLNATFLMKKSCG